jgi:hypothetical protein
MLLTGQPCIKRHEIRFGTASATAAQAPGQAGRSTPTRWDQNRLARPNVSLA